MVNPFLGLVSDVGSFQDQSNQCSNSYLWYEPSALSEPLDCPVVVPSALPAFSVRLPALLDDDLLCLPFVPLPLREQSNLSVNGFQRT